MKGVGAMQRKGFTVVELLIVIVVIAVLAAVVLVGYTMVSRNARDVSVKGDGKEIRDSLGVYGLKNGSKFVPWSSSAPNPSEFSTKMSDGNTADVTVTDDGKDWCARIINPNSSYNSVTNAYEVESTPGACDNTIPTDDAYAAAITSGWKRVSAGSYHTCGISYDNKAYCWGARDNSQGGNGSMTNSGTPLPVTTSGALQNHALYKIGGNSYGSCAIDTSYKLYCWGQNPYGQLGNGLNADSNVPVAVNDAGVLLNKKNIMLGSGVWHSCTVTSDFLPYCWGIGSSGNLGNGTSANSNVPVAVTTSGALSGLKIRDIAAGAYNSCVIDSINRLFCWGNNSYGQLGIGSTTSSTTAVAVSTSGALSGKLIRKVSMYNQTCVVASDAKAYCWGQNTYGAVGNGGTTDVLSPTAVSTSGVLSGKKVTAIAAGFYSTCALADDGKAYCWGLNSNGQLGNGTTTNSTTPVAVTSTGVLNGKYLWSITAGADFYCAQATDGNAYCWGRNVYGQLGNGAMTNSSVPVAVIKP